MRRLLAALVLLLAGLSPAVAQQAVHVPTYYGSVVNHATPIGATDVVCLEGAAGKVAKIAGFAISGTGATNVVVNIHILRRITFNTGGTSVLVQSAKGSSAHADATSVMRVWSSNPTSLGTPDGVFRRIRWDVENKVTVPPTVGLIAQMAANPYTTQPEARGATQAICMNFNAPATATVMDISMVWTETEN